MGSKKDKSQVLDSADSYKLPIKKHLTIALSRQSAQDSSYDNQDRSNVVHNTNNRKIQLQYLKISSF
ncbi:unnamed protein product [Schistosoma margrebowiei]|uniref:Uncharacterized protein n=1 Tax=Schistosoma margrebowiei TaxID=48269 RepID=A0A183MTN7_9TREM|nr:unnamed protein product [Schistosoma margrebowiei]